ncbi:MAG TPA: hypothetical protein VMW27_27470 [Thermoanaerobaculia bacterium]|nr:hypothetical protein [Thermoanaerobaculia bacterium]
MSAFNPRKRWAVWVIIAWLATVISVWAFETAGTRALAEKDCKTCRAPDDPCGDRTVVPRLELEHRQKVKTEILRCDQVCLIHWIKAKTCSDFLLIPSYSALFAFLFLLLSAPRSQGDPTAARPWAVIGIVLALTMLTADCAENFLLFRSIGPPCSLDAETLRLLWTATATKWGAVALASALAGVLALLRRTGWVTVLAGLLGLATAGVLTAGLYQASRELLNVLGGTVLLFLFFTAILVHAVIVIVKPDPVYIEPAAGGPSKP